jgi:hypothetical protein
VQQHGLARPPRPGQRHGWKVAGGVLKLLFDLSVDDFMFEDYKSRL